MGQIMIISPDLCYLDFSLGLFSFLFFCILVSVTATNISIDETVSGTLLLFSDPSLKADFPHAHPIGDGKRIGFGEFPDQIAAIIDT
jgi:hypothetical protein